MSILQLENLMIGYKASRKPNVIVASGINTTLESGELVCLIGPNGAGKTTLIRTIAGLQKPLDGHVLLMGEEVHRLKADEMARRLSVVLTERPNVGLLNGYALIALGRHPHTDWSGKLNADDEAVVRWAVEAVNAQEIAPRPVMELSDGQRQKIMIARALAQEPALMMLDEPTAFLDLPRRVEIMRLLKHLAHHIGRTVLVSTHDLDLALRTADRLWLMGQGGILLAGAPEDLILNGAFERVFASEGIEFDIRTGSFKINREHTGLIRVVGEGIPYVWTCRALEREGFMISSNGSKPIATVEVLAEMSGTCWRLQLDETTAEYASIYDLVRMLSSSKGK